MCTMQDDVVKLYKWYQGHKNSMDEEILLTEDFLTYHRLDAIYVSYCRDKGTPHLLSQALLEKNEKRSARHPVYRSIASTLSAKLKDNNVQHVFLKGIALAEEIYTEPLHRYFADLDILVDKDNLSIVENILMDMGYQYGFYSESSNEIHYPTPAEVLFQRTYTHEMCNMFRMETSTFASNIDTNFLFMWRGTHKQQKTFSVSDFSDHIVQSNDIPVFDKVVNLIHLCCHLYNEATFFALDRNYSGGDPRELLLIRVFDIALLANQFTETDYRSLAVLAQQMDCIGKVAYAFGLANLLLKQNIGQNIDVFSTENEEVYSGYYGKDQQYHIWPISIYDRVFDLQKKKEVSDTLFPLHSK